MITSCNCGRCHKCENRIGMQVKRAALPRCKRPETPASRRMNAIAETVWARHADPGYYAPAAERFRGAGGALIDRVVTL